MAGKEDTPLEHGSLEVTPTWAFTLVCAAFIIVSLILERGIHWTGKWVSKRPEKSLNKALDKVKEELMLVGFFSLLLVVVQPSVAKICLPHSSVHHMLPCKFNATQLSLIDDKVQSPKSSPSSGHRRLMFVNEHTRRILAGGAAEPSKCYSKGKVPLVSQEGLHELHIFIFVLAIGHVVYSCLTLLLARFQVHGWSAWEKKAQSEPPPENGFVRQGTFVRKHANSVWNRSRILSWIVCLVKQFGSGVTFTEYQTLRGGFIHNHNMKGTFDFHKYILRVLEDDFKKVVGISTPLWLFVIIFLLLNVNGWYTYFWIGFIPLALLLVIGAKLEHIVLTLAVEIAEEKKKHGENTVIKLRDDLFWFKRPKLILMFLHFILFQNAFELAFFVWVWTSFGFGSCFRNKLGFVVARLGIGALMLVLSSYRTLPMYALVSQMGDRFKFGEEINSALASLRAKARKKAKSGSVSSAHSPGPRRSPDDAEAT